MYGTGTPQRVFLTGGTGFLGSYLAAALLRRGSQVTYLARPTKRLPAAERVRQILDWHQVPPALQRDVRVVSGDVAQRDLGIAASTRRPFIGAFDAIIHCTNRDGAREDGRDGELASRCIPSRPSKAAQSPECRAHPSFERDSGV